MRATALLAQFAPTATAPEAALWMALPFAAILILIAAGPALTPGWWERNHVKVSLGLSALALGFYLFAGPGDFAARSIRTGHRAMEAGGQAFSFITLLGCLYVVAGGIHIRPAGRATPAGGVMFLAAGALLANVLGTTGASMLMIRPWLTWNRGRPSAHHTVFFIFIISNAGGGLTPIGDPPLLAGWLRGVPFWWVAAHGWKIWLTLITTLLAMFYWIDRVKAGRGPRDGVDDAVNTPESWRLEGGGNLGFLAVILGAAFLRRPAFLREALMISAAAASYLGTRPEVRRANGFDFHPLREVSVVFLGIFVTMAPALDWIASHAGSWNPDGAGGVYWAAGASSSVLDNMPSYMAFLQACLGSLVHPDLVLEVQKLLHGGLMAQGSPVARQALGELRRCFPAEYASGTASPDQIGMACLLAGENGRQWLLALSAGSVFFGACTYIGNSPNLMVRAIAARQPGGAPSFMRYVTHYVSPFLLPALALLWWLYFRG